MNIKKSKRVLKKYKYNPINITFVVLLFPFVFILSFIFSRSFTSYLFKYKRSGKDKHGIELNTLEQLNFDIKQKKLKDIEIKPEQVTEFEIGPEEKRISCVILNNNSDKWVVALHGFKRNKYIGLRNGYHFYKEGYNLISFDAYAHGKTYGTKSDFGVTNSKILEEVIQWIKQEHKPSVIGVIGVSMGAASAVFWAQQFYQENKIDWMIADCGLTQPVEQIRFFLKRYVKVPWWLISLRINGSFKKQSKTDLKSMNLQKNLDSLKGLPLLFIHGKKDSFITYHNSIVMYNEKVKNDNNAITILKLFDKAEHSASITTYQQEYWNLTLEFVKQLNSKNRVNS